MTDADSRLYDPSSGSRRRLNGLIGLVLGDPIDPDGTIFPAERTS